jgi:two-component system LytT family sensor kinase
MPDHVMSEAVEPSVMRRLPVWLLVPVACTVAALFFVSGGVSARSAFVQWYTWGALAGPIVWLDRRLPVRSDSLGARVLWHVPLSLAWSVVYLAVSRAVTQLLAGKALADALPVDLIGLIGNGAVQWSALYYWLIIGGHFALEYRRESQSRKDRTVELERLLVEAQLTALRAQLQPHFLYNALNTISAEVERRPQVARSMLEHLGELLRLSLQHARPDTVTLADELEMVERYLAIQRTRFAGRLESELDVAASARTALLPGLLLQPLVENAIHHGISPRARPGRVRIVATVPNGQLHVLVEDDGLGLPTGWTLEQHAGVGLSNTRRRLEAQYGSAHTFSVRPAPGGGVVASIMIPFEDAGSRTDRRPERDAPASTPSSLEEDVRARADRRR